MDMQSTPFRALITGLLVLLAACSDAVEPDLPPSITLLPKNGSITVGESYQVTASLDDPSGRLDTSALVWRSLDEGIATVSSTGLVRGVSPGIARIVAAAGSAADTTRIEVRDRVVLADCDSAAPDLAVGETRRYTAGAPLSLCLAGGARYALVAVNVGSEPAAAELKGEGLSSLPVIAAGDVVSERIYDQAQRDPLPIDREFERRLRQRERETLSPQTLRGGVFSRAAEAAPGSYAVGDLMQLNTSTTCDAPQMSTGRIEYVGEKAIVVADTANPGNLGRDVYARFGMLYDTLLYPVVTEHFGEPARMNGESRVVIYYTRAVNELTDEDSEGVVGGYFWSGDIFPRSACRGSNEREMFYMLAPDPAGKINGNVRTVDFVAGMTAGTIAHELQHLINSSRRLHVNEASEWEEPWLNEGLSHIAEELVFYHASGLGPMRNLDSSDLRASQTTVDAANRYAVSNLLRLDSYLRDVEAQGPFQSDDDLATRGASWHFLRYALDRKGGSAQDVLASLVDSPTSGFANLEAAFGVDPREWYVDNVVSLFTDDHVPGVDPHFTQPSWNSRDILKLLNPDGFVLQSRTLRAGESTSLELEAWGSAFVTAAVPAGGVGRIQVGGSGTPPSASLAFVLVRTR